jgi:multidrug efflux pump subunit AcrA (membrane-fusion protein)
MNPMSLPRRSFLSWIVAIAAVTWMMIHPAAAQEHARPDILEYKGTVAPALEGEVAPRIDGLLIAIKFKAGQYVKKGDLLFEFGRRDKELSLALAQARAKQAEAQLRLSDVGLKNAQTLQTRNVASEMQLLQAEAGRDIAAARVEEARAKRATG